MPLRLLLLLAVCGLAVGCVRSYETVEYRLPAPPGDKGRTRSAACAAVFLASMRLGRDQPASASYARLLPQTESREIPVMNQPGEHLNLQPIQFHAWNDAAHHARLELGAYCDGDLTVVRLARTPQNSFAPRFDAMRASLKSSLQKWCGPQVTDQSQKMVCIGFSPPRK